jgi:hypothetical protein
MHHWNHWTIGVLITAWAVPLMGENIFNEFIGNDIVLRMYITCTAAAQFDTCCSTIAQAKADIPRKYPDVAHVFGHSLRAVLITPAAVDAAYVLICMLTIWNAWERTKAPSEHR